MLDLPRFKIPHDHISSKSWEAGLGTCDVSTIPGNFNACVGYRAYWKPFHRGHGGRFGFLIECV